MTILWCGGEDIDFITSSAYNSATGLRTGYARTCLSIVPLTLAASTFTPTSSAWLSFQFNTNMSTSKYFGVGKSGTNSWIGVGADSSSKFYIAKYDGTTLTILATEPTVSWHAACKIDLHIVNYAVSGQAILYVDGIERANYSGDLTVLSQTTFDIASICGSGGYTPCISELIISTEDTRLMSLITLYPNAAGTTSGWTGAYTDIDEILITDTDLIYTSTANTEHQFNLSTRPAGTFISKAVKVATRAAKALTNGKDIQIGLRTGTTTALSATKTLDYYYSTQEYLTQVNPETGNPFTSGEIDALQVAVKAI